MSSPAYKLVEIIRQILQMQTRGYIVLGDEITTKAKDAVSAFEQDCVVSANIPAGSESYWDLKLTCDSECDSECEIVVEDTTGESLILSRDQASKLAKALQYWVLNGALPE